MKTGRFYTTFACLLAISFMLSPAEAQTPEEEAQQILAATEVKGGLIVHIGCGDGTLTAALRANESYIVHGLDADPCNIKDARAHIRLQELYGEVSVEQFDSNNLPYIDNLVNLLVSEQPLPFDANEILRVLAPNGVAYINDGQSWNMTVKDWPADMDEWSHFLRASNNNAVSQDANVGPLRHVQWIFEPKWTRNHHKLNSVSSIVTAKGRMFYIMDTGPAATFDVGAKWYLIAQDAFNGIMLWEKQLNNWTSTSKKFRSGPVQLPRTLVTDGDYVYLPLGVSTSLTAIDAATGAEVRNYQNTNYVEEVIYNDGVLYVLTGSPSSEQKLSVYPNSKSISAIDANNGNLIWKYDSPADITPVTLAVEGQRVFFHSANNVVCLDKSNSNVNWTKAIAADNYRKIGWARATLVVSDDVVLVAVAGQLRALSVSNGDILWNISCTPTAFSAVDVFVINGNVWTGPTFNKSYDLQGGTVTGTNSIMYDLQTAGHHHRCYREKATINYIIGGHRGMEFMDLTGNNNHYRHNWARGTCQYGMMPANGLCYAPPHSCGCYMEAKLFGFVALANTRTPWSLTTTDPNLEQGPAYGTVNIIDSYSDEWPTFRYNSQRSATTANVLPYDALGPQWQRDDVGAKLSAPTVADDKVLVADISGHRILAFDASNGDLLWSYTAGGRVDSPPTAYNGMVFFGSNDGYVYCLALNNGSLIWRFRAGPVKMYAMGQENVESLWPVHGSILIQDDTAYFAAGRSSYLDNGIYLYGLEPTTGAVKYSTLCKSAHGGVDKSLDDGLGTVDISQNTEDYKTRTHPDYSDSFSMAGGVTADVLSGDGTSVFMKSLRYNNMLVEQENEEAHFFSTSSILDGEENHRSHVIYGTGDFSRMPVAYSWIVYKNNRSKWITVPFGLKLSFNENENKIWGVLRGSLYGATNVLSKRYVLYSKDLGSYTAPDFQSPRNAYTFNWQKDIEMRARAMLCAGSYIYIGGMSNRIDADDPFAVIEGRRDGLLKIYNAGNGNKVFDMVLESPPVWDGMAAANGRLYLSLENGEVLCLSGNILPMVDAGEDQTIYPMATALLDANVTDDGFPFGTLTTDWTKFAGPGEVTFDDPCAVDTNASFSQWGRYTLRLTAFDGGASNYDDTNVFVCRPGDMDCDNDVDGLDMEQFAAQWLSSGCDDFNDWCSGADQKASGSVSFGSYAVVASNWLLGMEPAAPTNLVAVAGDSQVSLNWDDNTEADLAGYNVYRSSTSGSGYVQIASGVAVSNYVDNPVTNDTTYYYLVTAVDTGGYESDYSNEASATPHIGPGVTELDALPSGPGVVLVSVGPNQQNAAFERINDTTSLTDHLDYKKSGMTIEDAALDGDEVNMTSITLLFNLVKHNEATTVTIPDEAGHVMQFWFGQRDVSGVPQLPGVTNTIDVRGVTFTAGKYYRFTLDTPVTFDASAANDWAWQGWWTTDDIDNDLVWARTNDNDVFAGGMLYERDKTSTNTTFPFTDPVAVAGHDLIFAMEIGVE